MLVVYALLSVAGLIFCFDPSSSVQSAYLYADLTRVWGGFYVVGGVVAGLSLGIRTTRSNLIATWFFEIAGLSLLVAATIVYAVALFDAAFKLDSFQVAAVATVVLAFASSLGIRAAEAFEIVRIVRKYAKHFDEEERTNGG